MTSKRALGATISILAAAFAAAALAGCGSASSGSTSIAASASGSSSRTKLQACLKQHGVTLPAGFARGSRRPSGKPPGAGAGTPPASGAPPSRGGGGFGAGGADSARFKKMRAALKACGADFGQGRFKRHGGNFKPSAGSIATFSACVARHGYKLPKANTSGSGPIYPRKIESDKKFQAAAQACQSDLRPSGSSRGGGASTTGGSA